MFVRELQEVASPSEGQGLGTGLPNTVSSVSVVFWPGSSEWLLQGHSVTDHRPSALGGTRGISTLFAGLWGMLTCRVRSGATFPPSLMREPRRGEVKWLVQSHTMAGCRIKR